MAKREAKLIYKRKESPKWYYRFWVEGEEFKAASDKQIVHNTMQQYKHRF